MLVPQTYGLDFRRPWTRFASPVRALIAVRLANGDCCAESARLKARRSNLGL